MRLEKRLALGPPGTGALNGSRGRFHAPAHTCLIDVSHDGEAVLSWLQLHETVATRRAYRKEAERLLLWAVIQLGKPISSLTTDDATAYRAFLRNPTPQRRWVGPPRPRESGEWRPFAGGLAPKSIAYSLSVLGAMFRWLMAQHYVLANPFAGIKVRGAGDRQPLDKGRAFSQAEWRLVRTIADGLEMSYGWERGAADRVRFLLDFGYATGLRASELVGVKLRDAKKDERDDWWLHVVGKGAKNGKVALPPLARSALDHYAMLRCKRSPVDPDAPFLLTRQGKRPSRAGAEEAFKQIREQAGVRRVDGARYQPRLHDRHAFAVTRLVRWYREGADVQRLLPQLATYLGHVHITGTQRYLTMTPELLRQASLRFERFAFGGADHA